ncbi:MAG: DUF58 domain-containing protein [Gammaproteobacteria bacterium]|nr:DUF58 domain-containing protein [Gammaproteobacteria bacterium]
MIPRLPIIVLAAVLTVAGVAVAFVPAIAPVWLAAAGLFVLAALVDAIRCWLTKAPAVERLAPGSMSLMTWTDIQLTIRNERSSGSLLMDVFDHHPQTFETQGLPQRISVAAGRFVDLRYEVQPLERGSVKFSGCDLRIASPMRLWWRRRFVDTLSETRVYPNYSAISKLLAYEVDNRLQLSGVRLSRRRGEGIEFHQLRDYREGDSMRAIDWKATARMSRLISREYQDERDQQVVFVLDTGRRMLAKDGALSHFDHTLNAMLLLSFVALRQGDAAGLMTTGAERTWFAPRKGADTINGLLNHVYDVQPEPVEIDYIAAATDLAVRQRRRSLIVILTNVREEDSEDLRIATDLLQRRHLVILASLRERALDDSIDHDIHGFDDALLFASTNRYLDSRQESHKLLRAKGVYVEDCLSDELPAAITNRYLAIKRAGVL